MTFVFLFFPTKVFLRYLTSTACFTPAAQTTPPVPSCSSTLPPTANTRYFIHICCFLKGEFISYRQQILYFVFIGVCSDFVSQSAWAGVLTLWCFVWHAVNFQPQGIPHIQKDLFFFRFCVSVVQFCLSTQL